MQATTKEKAARVGKDPHAVVRDSKDTFAEARTESTYVST